MINKSIKKLVTYGIEKGLIEKDDKIYITNQIMALLNLSEYDEPKEEFSDINLEETLGEILTFATENSIIEDSVVYRDLFDTKIMGVLTGRPSEV